MTLNFEDLTIGQLRKITEDYERLKVENTKLKVKYPTRVSELHFKNISAEKLVEGLK